MTFLLNFFLLNVLNLELFAYDLEPPLKNYKDGSKSAFIQAPYVSVAREQVKKIQEEVTGNWPDGIINYYVEEKSYDSSIHALVRAAMSVLESSACIRFKAAKDKPEGNDTWLHISNPKKKRECVHEPDVKEGGEILLVLGYDCLTPRDLLHTLLHGIGLKDEVTHPHRDNYVKILWDNIQPAYRHLYRTQPVERPRGIIEYDPLSIMHFHDRAFSINGKATILPLETGLKISPSEGLSQLDKMKLHIFFGHECNKRKFVSLMETCKKSLNSKKDSASDENREKLNDKDDVTGEKGDSKNDNDNNEENEGKSVTDNDNKLLKGETGEEKELEENWTGEMNKSAENWTGEMNKSVENWTGEMNKSVENWTGEMNKSAENWTGEMNKSVENWTGEMNNKDDQKDGNSTWSKLSGNETKLKENDDTEETKQNSEEDNSSKAKKVKNDNSKEKYIYVDSDDFKEKYKKPRVNAIIGIVAAANSDASSGNVNQLADSDSATEKKMNSGINLNYVNYTD